MSRKNITCILLLIMLFFLCSYSLSKTVNIESIEPIVVPQVRITATEAIPLNFYTDCSISIIDSTGSEIILDDESSIKVRGNSTSAADKKPYNIKFSSKTNVLGMGQNKKWCLLANCFDKTLIRNITVFDFASSIGVPYTPDYRVVDVFINNRLMGNYLITDAIDVSPSRVDIDIKNNDFLLELDYNPEDEDFQYFTSSEYGIKFAINNPEKENLTESQFAYVTNLVTSAEKALRSGDYDQVSAFFDIDSMVNFYITLELFKNVDVNTSSTRFHIKDGILYGGPVWDYDLSAGNCCSDYYHDYFTQGDSGDGWEGLWATRMPWFDALAKCDVFKQKVKDRYLDLQDEIVNIYAENELGLSRIDYYLVTYKHSIEQNQNEAGWTTDNVYNWLQLERTPEPTYEENVAYYRNWMANRNEWLLTHWGLNS